MMLHLSYGERKASMPTIQAFGLTLGIKKVMKSL
jgi:hypothetical protein